MDCMQRRMLECVDWGIEKGSGIARCVGIWSGDAKVW